MRVKILTSQKSACDTYRCVLPAEALADEPDLEIDYSTSQVEAISKGKKIIDVKIDADVVVMPRPLHKNLLVIVPILQRRGIAVVAEIDDDFQTIPHGHSGWSNFQPHLSDRGDWQVTKKVCYKADFVTATTPALLERYAPHGRGVVIPNYISEEWLKIRELPEKTLGWAGSTYTHTGDLDEIGDAVSRIVNKTEYSFRHLGEGPAAKTLGVQAEPEGWVGYEDYPRELAKFGIGLAPLADNKFNEAKSWLKPLEYAALGVPVVMSPRADYRRINELGVGVLAKRERNWYNAMERLIDNHDYRTEMVESGIEAASQLTIERNAYKYAEAWKRAHELRTKN